MDKCLLIIYSPPALEETLVDWLLEQDQLSGFSTAEAYGHGSRQEGMSLQEQVSGRQKRIQFTLHAEQKVITGLIEQLKIEFAGTNLHFIQIPLTDCGSI
ncbi:MAG: DUF3240 family protein [Methylophilaceae bacterium]|nr:DUF3240 family protein [Methylophilaceae bacterium]